jgi:hypothetical protein
MAAMTATEQTATVAAAGAAANAATGAAHITGAATATVAAVTATEQAAAMATTATAVAATAATAANNHATARTAVATIAPAMLHGIGASGQCQHQHCRIHFGTSCILKEANPRQIKNRKGRCLERLFEFPSTGENIPSSQTLPS